MSILNTKKSVELNNKSYEVGVFTIGDITDIANYVKDQKDKLKKTILSEKKQEIIKDYKLANKEVDVDKLLNCSVSDEEILGASFNLLIVRYQIKRLLNRFQSVDDIEIQNILDNEKQDVIENIIETSYDLPLKEDETKIELSQTL